VLVSGNAYGVDEVLWGMFIALMSTARNVDGVDEALRKYALR
jgi:hypothetical protein